MDKSHGGGGGGYFTLKTIFKENWCAGKVLFEYQKEFSSYKKNCSVAVNLPLP